MIAPRVVLVGGLYIETGYGSSFDDVACVDGDEVVGGVPDTDTATCTNGPPQDLTVTFFVGEFAVGTSFKIHEKFWLGVALRLPFSKQVADLWQNIGAALVPPGSNTANYGRVKNDLGGILIKNWSVFLPATFINIAYCPPELRVLFLNCTPRMYTYYYAKPKHKPLRETLACTREHSSAAYTRTHTTHTRTHSHTHTHTRTQMAACA